MIKVAIIEDEVPARKKLRRFLEEQAIPLDVIAEIDRVEVAIPFLQTNGVDLIFSDIELLDGNAFDIYNQVQVLCPIIFTTAYDNFWMNAFDTNGIAYLLKPYSKERFQQAWDKFIRLRHTGEAQNNQLHNLTLLIEKQIAERSYKKSFLVHTHQEIRILPVESIAFFEAFNGVVFAYDSNGKKHILTEATLKEIEERLDPTGFFRLNRSEIIHKSHIEKIERYSKNTIAVKVKGCDRLLKSSQSSTAIFRKWIDE